MCLILLAWRQHPDFPLVLAANRDEFHARPSTCIAPWPDQADLFAGRDLAAGGTWLGFTAGGRFAAVTNVRDPAAAQGSRSRGLLPRDFLMGTCPPLAFCRNIEQDVYSGFNLLVGDSRELAYCSNRGGAPKMLAPGIYGLSNHLLDTPWPKLTTAKQAFSTALDALPSREAFFKLLTDREIVADENLPETGVSLEWERRLSAIFVLSPEYGTRASSVFTVGREGCKVLEERCYGPDGTPTQSSLISTGV